MKFIVLNHDQLALVDDIHYEYLNQYTWHFTTCRRGGYASRCLSGVTRKIFMHQEILILENVDIPRGMEIDHKDRDKLNNQMSNLRVVTRSINALNRGARVDSQSGIQGVNWDHKSNKWRSRIQGRFGRINLGMYVSFDEAVKVRFAAEVRFGVKEKR